MTPSSATFSHPPPPTATRRHPQPPNLSTTPRSEEFKNRICVDFRNRRRCPTHSTPRRYGYSKERFFWSLVYAVGIFCLGSGATIVHGVPNLWTSQPPEHIEHAALVIAGSFLIEGTSLIVAIHAVRKAVAAEGMKVRDYVWLGHDPTTVAVMTEDGAAVTGLAIAGASLVAVNATGNAIYDPVILLLPHSLRNLGRIRKVGKRSI